MVRLSGADLNMRQIVLDTETTGLEVTQNHRIIEIGAVELDNRRLTGKHFHRYIQPDRAIDAGAAEVHGITEDYLADKPRFHEVVDEFLNFIEGSEVIIHNAAFDVAFLDYEFRLCKANTRMDIICSDVVDSLALARKEYPGQRNNLDALCKRLGIDNSRRKLHGALLDAEILAEVYLGMTGGQSSLGFDSSGNDKASNQYDGPLFDAGSHPPLRVVQASADALKAHSDYLEKLDEVCGDGCAWKAGAVSAAAL